MLLAKIISVLVALVVIVLSIDGSAAPQPEIAAPPPTQETGATAQNGLAEHLTVDQARELVARMSDREVRELLLKHLNTLHAEIQPLRAEPVSMFFNVQENMYVMRNRLRELLAAVPELPSIGPFIVMRITKGYESSHIWGIGLYFLIIFAGALSGEFIFLFIFRPVVKQVSRLATDSEFGN